MIAYIKGNLEVKANNYVVIDVGGVGYKIFMSASAIEKIGETGKQVKVHTYYYVREDNISLYGFNTLEELKMFELLLSVSGIGAKSAITMLSEISPSNFALAVISNDVKALTKISGVGPKSAQRIILELKDKLKTEQAITSEQTPEIKVAIENNGKVEEAISALQVLGYNKKEIEKAFMQIKCDDLSVEELIKQGLKILGM
ncbi:MAG: Holliday junction branch migration protein RuvA [Clostridia bacterium]|nr:Holliday junction branch migration protein RuvA [Clostridia bacterium]